MSDEERKQEVQQEEQFDGLIDIVPKMLKGEYEKQSSTQNEDNCSGIKGLILGLGDGLANATAILLLIALVIASLITMFSVDFLQGILLLLVGLVILTIIFYTIYCIIDARYNLKKIADNTSQLLEIKKHEK